VSTLAPCTCCARRSAHRRRPRCTAAYARSIVLDMFANAGPLLRDEVAELASSIGITI
jgi:hypothetical protein